MIKKNLISTAVALACLSLAGCDSFDGEDDNNIAPAFNSGTSFDVDEGINTDTGYTALASDANGDTVTYQISGSDAGQFLFDTSSGTLTFNETPDFETPTDDNGDNVYKVVITATDGRNSFITQNVSITVGDIFENIAPIFSSETAVSVVENSILTGYSALATDDNADDAVTYSITGGADQSQFEIDTATGVLSFTQAPDFETPTDANADNVCEVEITAKDSNGAQANLILLVTITDVDEVGNEVDNTAPEFISLTTATVNNGVTATGYVALAIDIDSDVITYSISGGADMALFSIDSASGVLSFLQAADFANPADADGDNVYLLELSADDGDAGAVALNLALTVTQDAAPLITLTHEVGFPINNGNVGGTTTTTTMTGIVLDASGADVNPSHISSITVNGVDATWVDNGDVVSWSASVDISAVTAGTPLNLDVVVVPDGSAAAGNSTSSQKLFNETLATSTFTRTTGVVYDEVNNQLLLLDRGNYRALYAIDLATASATVISRHERSIDTDGDTIPDTTIAEVGTGLKIEAGHDLITIDENTAYVVDFTAANQDGRTKDKLIYSIDLTTGNRTILSANSIVRLESIEAFGTKLITTAYATNDSVLKGLFVVDPATGVITALSNNDDGKGDNFSRPQSLDMNSDETEILVIDRDKNGGALYKVDPLTGNRSFVSTDGVGSGPSFGKPFDVAYFGDTQAYVIDQTLKALILVDLTTGDRTIASDDAKGTGPSFAKPERIVVDAKHNRAFITDSGADTLFMVDLATGNRVAVIDQAGLEI